MVRKQSYIIEEVRSLSQLKRKRNEKKEIKKGIKIAYLCNKKACGNICPSDVCKHTLNIKFAKHDKEHLNGFIKLGDDMFWEKDDEI